MFLLTTAVWRILLFYVFVLVCINLAIVSLVENTGLLSGNYSEIYIWSRIHTYVNVESRAKVYIPSTINIWKKVLNKAIWAGKKWAGFWQISLYIK